MTQYTDADVARMLGWTHSAHQLWQRVDGRYIELPIFGLSTTPSPDADANTARYVIPFIEAQGWYFRYEIDCGDHVVTITDADWIPLGDDLGDCFASTVCRASLQAWEAKKGTNHE